jgi:hypothetical protein
MPAHLEFFVEGVSYIFITNAIHIGSIVPLHIDWLLALQFVMLQPPPLLFLWLYFPPSFTLLSCVLLLMLCHYYFLQDSLILNKDHYM